MKKILKIASAILVQVFLITSFGLCAGTSTLSPALNIGREAIKFAYLFEKIDSMPVFEGESCPYVSSDVFDVSKEIAHLVETAFAGFVEDAGAEKPDIDKGFNKFMKMSIKMTGASYGAILLKDKEKPFLDFKYFTGPASRKLKYLSIPDDVGISGQVIERKEPMIANEDQTYKVSRVVDKFTDLKTRNLLCFPIIVEGRVIGVLELVNKDGSFKEEDIEIVENLFRKQKAGIEEAVKYKKQKASFLAACIKLADAIEARDLYTGGHVMRVRRYTLMILEELGLSEKEKYEYQIAAILHDIGKISIPDRILNKEGPLTDEEFEVIKKHTSLALAYLEKLYVKDVLFTHILSRFVDWERIKQGILFHHERIDGGGYFGLTGEKIPAIAKILTVADVFDALTSDRVYHKGHKGMPFEKAIEELKENRDLQVCPEVVDAFIRAIKKKKNLPELLTQEDLIERALSDDPVIAEKALKKLSKIKGVKAKRFESGYLLGKEKHAVHGFWELEVLLGEENTERILDGIIRSALEYGKGDAVIIVRIIDKENKRLRFIIQDNGSGFDLADVGPKMGISSLSNGEIHKEESNLRQLLDLLAEKFQRWKIAMKSHDKYKVFSLNKAGDSWRSRLMSDPEINKGLRIEMGIPIPNKNLKPKKVDIKQKTYFEKDKLVEQAI